MSYFVLPMLLQSRVDVSFSSLITSVGEGRADFSAFVY